MIEKFRQKIINFVESEKETPYLASFICGFTPMMFHYANNYWAVNSWPHLGYFTLSFLGVSFLIFLFLYFGFKSVKILKNHIAHLFLILILLSAFIFLYHSFFRGIKRGSVLLIAILFIGYFLWKSPRKGYKQIIVFLFAFSSISFFRVLIHIYEDIKPEYWVMQNDDIESVKFKFSPNIYMIQPDGYVSQNVMEGGLYNFESNLYNWLRDNEFKVYEDFRSNYPASLTSNVSLFGMKQHKFAKMLFPEIEMANARDVISAANPVANIFNNNNYSTYFIAEDEYFQQNKKQSSFDNFNIQIDDFPFNSKGDDAIRDVFSDLKMAMTDTNESPKFFFVEKLLPHHVAFYNTEESIREERDRYISRIKEANIWLKTVIEYISKNDKEGIIIILADHGGWVGLKSFNHLFSINKPDLVKSTFSNIAAIKWNGYLVENYDKDLKTNVNIFRVLFAVLSENPEYLDFLEDDSSYNLRLNSFGFKKVEKQIDDKGEIVN